MTSENYLIREVGTHNTQIVHRIRLRPYMPQGRVKDLESIDPNKFVADPRYAEIYKKPFLFDSAREQMMHEHEDDQLTLPDVEITNGEKSPKTRKVNYTNTPGVEYKMLPRSPIPPAIKKTLNEIRAEAQVSTPTIVLNRTPQRVPNNKRGLTVPHPAVPISYPRETPKNIPEPQTPPRNMLQTSEPPERERAVRREARRIREIVRQPFPQPTEPKTQQNHVRFADTAQPKKPISEKSRQHDRQIPKPQQKP